MTPPLMSHKNMRKEHKVFEVFGLLKSYAHFKSQMTFSYKCYKYINYALNNNSNGNNKKGRKGTKHNELK